MNIFRLILALVIFAALATAGWWFFLRERVVETGTPPPTTTPLPPDDGRFRWGIQVRPYALNRYSDELMGEQLDLAKELGVGWIRLDWHDFNDFAWHDNIIKMANDRGIHVVLILEAIGVPTEEPGAPERARARTQEIASHFKGKIRYYQLFNEVAGTALKGPQYEGTNFARDFNEPKYREIRDWMKEAIAGIKAADSSAKTIVSAQWTHTGFIEQLIKDGVSFDILGWNWFSDMPNDLNKVIINTGTNTSLIVKLKGFGKELWLTELGHRPGEAGQNEPAQAVYVREMAERIVEFDSFKALFVFELMDQSEVNSKGGEPEYYGIVGFTKDAQGNWIIGGKKQAFDAYREVIAKLSK